MIVRPGFSRQYIHSTRQNHWDSAVAHFVDWDIRYIEEKLMSWRTPELGTENDPIVTQEVIASRCEITGPVKWFVQRLAKANTRRREQLCY